jgi:tagatose 1,6-diphosphate aldolase
MHEAARTEAGLGHRLGTLRGLDACATARGAFAVLALDHRGNLRRLVRPDGPDSVKTEDLVAFKRAVLRGLAGAASGVLLDPEVGAAQAIADGSLPGGVGLIVSLEATGYAGPGEARTSRILPGWSVAKARRLGADAVKLLIYYHPDAQNAADQERLLISVAEDCAREDIALFLEPLSFAIDEGAGPLSEEARRDVVIRTARRLSALGGDVLKAEFPYDPSVTDQGRWQEACAELDEASSVPWVVLSAGVDAATFEAQTLVACRSGASGVLVGRSVWDGAVVLSPTERDAWLTNEGSARLRRLVELVDREARPWRPVSPLGHPPEPGPEWFLDDPV